MVSRFPAVFNMTTYFLDITSEDDLSRITIIEENNLIRIGIGNKDNFVAMPLDENVAKEILHSIMKAFSNLKIESDYLVALSVDVVEGKTCVAVTCNDYDHYKKLPEVISHNGILCGKTGWNSDKDRCYYQSGVGLVKKV